MVSIDTDPLDGPRISTSDLGGSAKRSIMYLLGAGIFFAMLSAAQATVTPAAESALEMVPGVQTGGSDSGPWSGW